MGKSILATLKVTAMPRIAASNDPIVVRRQKLITRLQEQRAMAMCAVEGKTFAAERQKKVKDEAGNVSMVTVPKKVKAWFQGSDDQVLFEVRYGNVPIELAAGKSAIEVGAIAKLVPTIDTVIEAANNGEFDALLKKFDKPAKSKAAAK